MINVTKANRKSIKLMARGCGGGGWGEGRAGGTGIKDVRYNVENSPTFMQNLSFHGPQTTRKKQGQQSRIQKESFTLTRTLRR